MVQGISERTIRGFKPGRKPIWRALGNGLFVKVNPNGRKVFVLRRGIEGRDAKFEIGEYPSMSLAQAIDEAGGLRKRIRHEGDFRVAERAAIQAQRANTIARLVDAWLPEATARLRPSTLARYDVILRNHILPQMGERPVGSITHEEVAQLAARIQDAGKARTANMAVVLIGKLYAVARRKGLVARSFNPTDDFEPYPEGASVRFLSDAELQTWAQAVNDASVAPGGTIKTALLLCLYTAQRCGEVAGARCGEFDLKEGVWSVPGARTKSGRDNLVPLTPRMLEIIMSAPNRPGEAPDDAPLFPLDVKQRRKRRNRDELPPIETNAPLPRTSLTQGMATMCKALKLAHASPHDLRRTARTVMSRERLGITYDDAERVLS
jgi:integrase